MPRLPNTLYQDQGLANALTNLSSAGFDFASNRGRNRLLREEADLNLQAKRFANQKAKDLFPMQLQAQQQKLEAARMEADLLRDAQKQSSLLRERQEDSRQRQIDVGQAIAPSMLQPTTTFVQPVQAEPLTPLASTEDLLSTVLGSGLDPATGQQALPEVDLGDFQIDAGAPIERREEFSPESIQEGITSQFMDLISKGEATPTELSGDIGAILEAVGGLSSSPEVRRQFQPSVKSAVKAREGEVFKSNEEIRVKEALENAKGKNARETAALQSQLDIIQSKIEADIEAGKPRKLSDTQIKTIEETLSSYVKDLGADITPQDSLALKSLIANRINNGKSDNIFSAVNDVTTIYTKLAESGIPFVSADLSVVGKDALLEKHSPGFETANSETGEIFQIRVSDQDIRNPRTGDIVKAGQKFWMRRDVQPESVRTGKPLGKQTGSGTFKVPEDPSASQLLDLVETITQGITPASDNPSGGRLGSAGRKITDLFSSSTEIEARDESLSQEMEKFSEQINNNASALSDRMFDILNTASQQSLTRLRDVANSTMESMIDQGIQPETIAKTAGRVLAKLNKSGIKDKETFRNIRLKLPPESLRNAQPLLTDEEREGYKLAFSK
jgi:hypothetical protein